MVKHLRKIFFIVFAVYFLFLLVSSSLPASAQWTYGQPIVPCGIKSLGLPECTICDLFKLVRNIIDFVLIGLMPPLATLFFVIGGILILMGGANPGFISKGKSIFWNTFIGVVVIALSWVITNTLLSSLSPGGLFQNWWQFQCTEISINPNPTPTPTPTLTSTPTPNPINLIITTSSLSDGSQSSNYSQTLSASGGTKPYQWSVVADSLPDGLSLDESSGIISGTPSVQGTFNFTVQVNDSANPVNTATKQLSIKVAPATVVVTISAVAVSNITDTGATITWTTNVPSTSQVEYGTTTSYGSSSDIGLSLTTSHVVTLTGLVPGTLYDFRAVSSITSPSSFTARSSNGTFMTTGPVSNLKVTTASLPDGSNGVAYSQTLAASGGTSPYRWAVTSGALPSGLSINSSTGTISGTPDFADVFTFTVQVSDSSIAVGVATKQLSIKVTAPINVACMYNGVNYSTFNLCSGQQRPGGCGSSTCSQYSASINKYAGGAATANVLKAFMVIESDCNIGAGSATSFGLMQLSPGTANAFDFQCGVPAGSVTSGWLTNPANADKSICLAAAYINSIAAGACGSNPRNIYAGYNGGAAGSAGACASSADCTGTSCGGGPIQRWECPYDDTQHTVCNEGYYQTKQGATYVNYCLNNLGF